MIPRTPYRYPLLMTEYANTRFTGFIHATMAASAVPVEVPLTLRGDSTEYTVLEGEGFHIDTFSIISRNSNGYYEMWLSYDDDGATRHIPFTKYALYSGSLGENSNAPGEYYSTYPAPAGKTWKVWCLGPNSLLLTAKVQGTITNKQ